MSYKKTKYEKLKEILNSPEFIDYQDAFYSDFSKIKKEDFEKFVNNPEYVDAWKKIHEGVVNGFGKTKQIKLPEELSKNPDIIKKIGEKKNLNDFWDVLEDIYSEELFSEKLLSDFVFIEKIVDVKIKKWDITFNTSCDIWKLYESDFVKNIKKHNLTETDYKEMFGDFKHFDKFDKPEQVSTTFTFLRDNLVLRKKVQKTALLSYIKGLGKDKAKDFFMAYLQELVSNMIFYPIKKSILGKDAVQKLDFNSYMLSADVQENCIRNGICAILPKVRFNTSRVNTIIGVFGKCLLSNSSTDLTELCKTVLSNKELEINTLILHITNCVINVVCDADFIKIFDTKGKLFKALGLQSFIDSGDYIAELLLVEKDGHPAYYTIIVSYFQDKLK